MATVEDWLHLREEAEQLIGDAEASGIALRALGSVGVHLHCFRASDEMHARGRVPKDIDLVCSREGRRQVRQFFADHGYAVDRDVLVAMEGRRYIFRNTDKEVEIDLWVDELDFCHSIDVGRRLGEGPTLALEDLVLSKLQIVEITPNDETDLISMLATHPVSADGPGREVIDGSYIAGLLANDWGFWRTATANLVRIRSHATGKAAERIDDLSEMIAEEPKTMRWRFRARIGERVRWWQEVDIPRRTY